MNTKAVIFDLDDTLISEMEYARSGYAAVAEAIAGGDTALAGLLNGQSFTAAELNKRFLDLSEESTKEVFNRFLRSVGAEDSRENVMALVKAYRDHKPEISYHKDVKATLRGLKEKGFRTGILSDGYAVTQRRKVEALRAEKDFDVIILTDEIGRDAWKPSLTGFNKISEELGVALGEMLYIGDNPEKDFYISHISDIRTARITRSDGVYRSRDYREGIREDYTLSSLTDILKIL